MTCCTEKASYTPLIDTDDSNLNPRIDRNSSGVEWNGRKVKLVNMASGFLIATAITAIALVAFTQLHILVICAASISAGLVIGALASINWCCKKTFPKPDEENPDNLKKDHEVTLIVSEDKDIDSIIVSNSPKEVKDDSKDETDNTRPEKEDVVEVVEEMELQEEAVVELETHENDSDQSTEDCDYEAESPTSENQVLDSSETPPTSELSEPSKVLPADHTSEVSVATIINAEEMPLTRLSTPVSTKKEEGKYPTKGETAESKEFSSIYDV